MFLFPKWKFNFMIPYRNRQIIMWTSKSRLEKVTDTSGFYYKFYRIKQKFSTTSLSRSQFMIKLACLICSDCLVAGKKRRGKRCVKVRFSKKWGGQKIGMSFCKLEKQNLSLGTKQREEKEWVLICIVLCVRSQRKNDGFVWRPFKNLLWTPTLRFSAPNHRSCSLWRQCFFVQTATPCTAKSRKMQHFFPWLP